VDKVGELEPNNGGLGSQKEEERELLSEIIQKINTLYGIQMGDEDKITLDKVFLKVTSDDELTKVMNGRNTEDDKKDFFVGLFKDELGDYTGERLDFYRKVMDPRVFPMVVESMYRSFSKSFSV
jgi:type I restriction enzyme R subunit